MFLKHQNKIADGFILGRRILISTGATVSNLVNTAVFLT